MIWESEGAMVSWERLENEHVGEGMRMLSIHYHTTTLHVPTHYPHIKWLCQSAIQKPAYITKLHPHTSIHCLYTGYLHTSKHQFAQLHTHTQGLPFKSQLDSEFFNGFTYIQFSLSWDNIIICECLILIPTVANFVSTLIIHCRKSVLQPSVLNFLGQIVYFAIRLQSIKHSIAMWRSSHCLK